MKISILIVTGVLLLSACSTTQPNTSMKHLDLIGDKEAVLDYWLISKIISAKYPQQAKTQGISGCVEFSLIINANGKATNAKIIKSFPEGVFDKQAMRAIKQWRWAPTDTNSNKQPVATTIQHDFALKNSPNRNAAYKYCKI